LKRITLVVDNQIGDDGAKAIAAMLEKNATITTVDLHCKLMCDIWLKRIILVVGNQIGEDGAKAIAKMLENQNTITSVSLNCKYVTLIEKNNTLL